MPRSASPVDVETRRRRRDLAIAGANRAVAALREMGVSALVTGSLAEGRFGPRSDIDLLVTDCPKSLKYAIEGFVEDCLAGFAFDLVYLDEIPPRQVSGFVEKARDVSALD